MKKVIINFFWVICFILFVLIVIPIFLTFFQHCITSLFDFYLKTGELYISLLNFFVSFGLLVLAIIVKDEWKKNEKFKKKLEILDKLQKSNIEFENILESYGNKIDNYVDKSQLKKIKKESQYIINEFEGLYDDNDPLKETLKELYKNLQDRNEIINELLSGKSKLEIVLFRIIERTQPVEHSEYTEYTEPLTKPLKNIYKKLYTEHWK